MVRVRVFDGVTMNRIPKSIQSIDGQSPSHVLAGQSIDVQSLLQTEERQKERKPNEDNKK